MANTDNHSHANVEDLLFEMDALNAVLRTIEGTNGDRAEAIAMVETALSRRAESEDLSEILITLAMQKIVGTVSPLVIHRPSTETNDLGRLDPGRFEFFDHYLMADTSIQWLNHVHNAAVFLLWPAEAEDLPVESAVHENVLRFWRAAILHSGGDLSESQRLFKRALEIGAHFGTDSHVLVSWSYAATFFTEAE